MSSRLRTRLRAGTGLSTPSLSLEFQTATGALDPRITFSRTSQATLVDSTGKLTYAPNNLLVNSEDFEAAAWTKTAATIAANAAVAPNGTTTADKFVENSDASPALHVVARAGAVVTGLSYVLSIYAKAAERTQLAMQLGTTVSYYNLSSGTVISGAGVIQSVGDGWYRCSLYVASAANSTCAFYTAVSGSATYQGNGTSGIFIWGAQLEQVTYQTTPGTYNSTSPKNLLGYTQEFDNAAWTKSNAFVQTNLLTYSEAFDNAAWAKGAAGTGVAPVVTANAATAPDGTTTADLVVFDRGAGNALADRSTLSQAPTVANATAYSHSIYLKAATAGDVGKQIAFRGVAGGGYQVVTLTSSWVRVNITETSISTTGNFELATRGTITTSNQVSVHLWGAQLVQGSTAGDYQRTDAAAAAVQYVAPDGSRTADLMVPTAVSGNHQVSQGVTTTASPFTYSVYAKAGGYDWLALAITDSGSTARIVYFNINTGVTGTGATGVTTSISAAGNGWYRCSATVSAALAGSNTCRIYATNTDGALAFTGNDTSGIYIWGAQLSNSASLDPYVYNPVAAPTSAAYYGPRFDYDPVTLANKGLLIEEQRTNLLTYSADLSNAAWPKTNVTVTSAATVSPDGTVNAQRIAATASAGTVINNSATAVAATSATFTVYVKQGTGATVGNYFGIRNNTTATTLLLATVNLSTGAVVSYINGTTGISLQNAGNGWWRVTATVTSGVTSGDALLCYVGFAGQAATAGDFIYAYGAQLEAGSFATSYIPTVASQVTRTADVALMQGANFSNWYNQNEGAIYAEFDQYSITSPNNQWAVFASDGTANNYLGSMTNPSSYRGLVVVGGSTQASIINGTVSANTLIKSMLAYKANDFAATSNGLAVGTDTSGSVPVVNSLTLGSGGGSAYLNGHIRRIGYYNTRLPNTALVPLTAPNIIPSLSLDFTTQVFNVG